MRGAAAVEGGAPGHKAALLCIVRTPDQSHVFAHAVSVVVRRSESVLCHHPARGEDDKVYSCNAGLQGWAREHGEYGGVKVVERHSVDHAEGGKVVLIRRVVAVPSHDIERAVILLAHPQRPPKLVNDDVRGIHLLKRSVWLQEVTGSGEAVGAYGPKVWQLKVASKSFANVTCEVSEEASAA
jgi:hypothetical protein